MAPASLRVRTKPFPQPLAGFLASLTSTYHKTDALFAANPANLVMVAELRVLPGAQHYIKDSQSRPRSSPLKVFVPSAC